MEAPCGGVPLLDQRGPPVLVHEVLDNGFNRGLHPHALDRIPRWRWRSRRTASVGGKGRWNDP